jgi:hypothetical protein
VEVEASLGGHERIETDMRGVVGADGDQAPQFLGLHEAFHLVGGDVLVIAVEDHDERSRWRRTMSQKYRWMVESVVSSG